MEIEVRIEDWAHLQQELFLETPSDYLRRFRSPYAFRGLTDAAFPLSTSLMRLNNCWSVDQNLEDIEEKLLASFRMYAYRLKESELSYWYWLSLAQHHGLPTRLLDWTWSPYVALHFATANLGLSGDDKDAVIWCVNVETAHKYLPDKPKKILTEIVKMAFVADVMNDVAKDLEELSALSEEAFVVFFEPPSIDDRIVNQFALFSIMSTPRDQMDDWLAEKVELCEDDAFPLYRKIVIPHALKWEIRDKLDNANITERMLFPGLEGLSAWLKRHYSCGPLMGQLEKPTGPK